MYKFSKYSRMNHTVKSESLEVLVFVVLLILVLCADFISENISSFLQNIF